MRDDFAVRCRGCGFRWNTPGMAEPLRLIGSCPRCNGELDFAATPGAPRSGHDPDAAVARGAPHMVLGVPRR